MYLINYILVILPVQYALCLKRQIKINIYIPTLSNQHSNVSNYIAKPALFLLYKQYCPVAMINFPVAIDILALAAIL